MKSASSPPSEDCELCERGESHPLFLFVCEEQSTSQLHLGDATNPDKQIKKLNEKPGNRRQKKHFKRLTFIGPFTTDTDKQIAKAVRKTWKQQAQEKTLHCLAKLLHAYDSVIDRVTWFGDQGPFDRVWAREK
jgi:hypothetical protein